MPPTQNGSQIVRECQNGTDGTGEYHVETEDGRVWDRVYHPEGGTGVTVGRRIGNVIVPEIAK